MINVYKNIYVGNQEDLYQLYSNNEWSFLHCAQQPFHREMVGYTGFLNKNHSNYRSIIKGNRMALNIVDMNFFNLNGYEDHFRKMFTEAIEFLNKETLKGNKILIHCNQGMSRGPSLAMLYISTLGAFNYKGFEDTEKEFNKLYPNYNPAINIKGTIKYFWNEFVMVREV